MGPSPAVILDAEISFNGATPFQTWKFLSDFRGHYLRKSFNGATPFQTWKWGDVATMMALLNEKLQWGHAFSDVEIWG